MGTEGSTALEPLWQGLPTPDATSVSGSASCALPPCYEAVSSSRDFTRRTLRRWGLTEELDDVALVVSELVTNAMRHGLTLGADHGAASGDEGDPPVRLHLMRWSARLVCAVRDPSDQPPDATAVRRTAAHREAYGGFGAGNGRRGGHGGRTALADSMEYGGSMDRGGSPGDVSPLGNGGNGGNGGHGGAVQAVDAFDALGALDSEEFEAPGFTAESGRGLCLVDSFSDNWGWHPLSGPLAGKIVWALFRVESRAREGSVISEPAVGRPPVSEPPGRRTRRP